MLVQIKIGDAYCYQYNNTLHPGGSCNFSSLAMALDYYKKPVAGTYERTADRLLDYADRNGLDRHALEVIRDTAKHFGLGDNARYDYTFEDIKKHLKSGYLCIVQGDFTPSGHVMVVAGVDEDKGAWWCYDPAGQWDYNTHHYDLGGSGNGIWYPSTYWKAAAAPDGKVWAHLLTLG